MPAYVYRAGSERRPRAPDLGLAAKFETAAIEVVAAVTDASGETTITVNASLIGDLFLVVPVLDPDGVVVNGWMKEGGLRTTPFMCLDIPTANAPAATSGLDVSIGIVDGELPLINQWADGGFRFDDVIGPRSTVAAWDIAAIASAPVAGGIFSAFDLAFSPSTNVKGGFARLGRSVLGLDSEGGTGLAQQVLPNDDYTLAPSFLVRIRATGAGVAAETFKFSARYQASFVQ